MTILKPLQKQNVRNTEKIKNKNLNVPQGAAKKFVKATLADVGYSALLIYHFHTKSLKLPY